MNPPDDSPLARAAEQLAPLAPKRSRRAIALDHVRVADYARRLDAGEDWVDAGWTVLSDPRSGYTRWRGLPASRCCRSSGTSRSCSRINLSEPDSRLESLRSEAIRLWPRPSIRQADGARQFCFRPNAPASPRR